MRAPGDVARDLERAGDRSTARPWVQRLARAGYCARGAVYAVIGALALRLALGDGGRTTDSRGALASIAAAPFGKVLVVALAAGLAGLALWSFLEAIADPGRPRRSNLRAAAVRVARVVAGVAHGALAYAALRLAAGAGPARSGARAAESWTARGLELPAGRWLVLAGAAIVIAVGARRIWSGARRKFLERLDLAAAGARLSRWAGRLGAAGLSAQGAMFVLVGIFFAQAAIRHDPDEATGFDGALAAVSRQPAGMVLLAVVALGLLAYAAYSLIEARHRDLGRR